MTSRVKSLQDLASKLGVGSEAEADERLDDFIGFEHARAVIVPRDKQVFGELNVLSCDLLLIVDGSVFASLLYPSLLIIVFAVVNGRVTSCKL